MWRPAPLFAGQMTRGGQWCLNARPHFYRMAISGERAHSDGPGHMCGGYKRTAQRAARGSASRQTAPGRHSGWIIRRKTGAKPRRPRAKVRSGETAQSGSKFAMRDGCGAVVTGRTMPVWPKDIREVAPPRSRPETACCTGLMWNGRRHSRKPRIIAARRSALCLPKTADCAAPAKCLVYGQMRRGL